MKKGARGRAPWCFGCRLKACTTKKSGAADDFEDGLGLDDHLVLVEEMEALNEQLVAAALDVEDAERGALLILRGDFGGHQFALAGVIGDLVLGGVVQSLSELFFLGADHVLDVATGGGHFVILFAPAGDRLEKAAVGEGLAVGDDDFGESIFTGREGDDVAAFDEPDVGFVGTADDLFRSEDFEKLGVESPLVQQECETS